MNDKRQYMWQDRDSGGGEPNGIPVKIVLGTPQTVLSGKAHRIMEIEAFGYLNLILV
jgi:hypothetical protein